MPADRVYNVLFLCTGNSARSVLGEVLTNALGAPNFRGYSAGSHPRGSVHPLTLEVLRAHNLPTEGLRSKSWDDFAAPGAAQMDFIFTVCDDAAGEACPFWPGHPKTAHWGIKDPANVEGSEVDRLRAFEDAYKYMRNRVAAFVALPISKIGNMTLQAKIRNIGALDGATTRAGDAA